MKNIRDLSDMELKALFYDCQVDIESATETQRIVTKELAQRASKRLSEEKPEAPKAELVDELSKEDKPPQE